jgi:hypothetical protein
MAIPEDLNLSADLYAGGSRNKGYYKAMNFDALVKSRQVPFTVIPASAGIATYYEAINF